MSTLSSINGGLIFDGVIGILLIVFLYKGLVKGFSGEIIGLVGLFVSSFCAWKFLDPAVDLVMRYVSNPSLDRTVISLICSVVIFFTVEIIFAVIGALLTYLVKVTQLSAMDHLMGMIIGLIKTFCIILFVYGVVATFSKVLPSDWLEKSYTMKGAAFVWPYLRDFLQAHEIIDFTALTGGI